MEKLTIHKYKCKPPKERDEFLRDNFQKLRELQGVDTAIIKASGREDKCDYTQSPGYSAVVDIIRDKLADADW